MTLFDIEDIKTEDQAIIVADSLSADAIKASCAQRNKSRKIRICSAKIDMLAKWCIKKEFQKPIKQLRKDFDTLEEAKAEISVNLWGI